MAGAKKLKDIFPFVAAQTGYTEEEVANLVNMFYNEHVRESLSDFKNAHIFIEHLGTFNLRRSQVPSFVKQLQKNIENNEKVLATNPRMISGESPMKAVIEKQIENNKKALVSVQALEEKVVKCQEERKKLHNEKLKIYNNELATKNTDSLEK